MDAPLAPPHGLRRRVFRLASVAPVYVIAGFTIFLLVLLWSALAYQLSRDKAAVLEAARSNSDNLARAYAEHVFGTLRLADQQLLRIKEDYEKRGAAPDFAPREDSLASAATLLIAVTDEQGHITASSLQLPQDARDTADRAYFRVHAAGDSGQLYISEPLQGRATGKQVIALSRRLNKPDGSFAGIVFASFDPEYLSSFFRDFAVGKNSSSAIIGRDMIVRDMIRGAGRATGAIGKTVSDSKLAPALARSANGSYTNIGPFDGIKRFYSYRSLPDYPLIVRASIAEGDVLANFDERKSWLLGVAAALSLIFVAVAGFQLRQMTIQATAANVLRRTQELLNESQRVAKLGYVFRDVPSDRVHWSDSMYELRGVSRGEKITRDKVAQLMEPEDHARYRAMRAEAFPQRRGFEIDMRMRMPDGARRWEHRVVHPHFDERGELTAVLIVVQDVTEQKRAALALQRSRELLARAQRIANLGSFERDLVTGGIRRSEEFYRLWGIAEENSGDISAEQLVEFIHPDDRQKFLEGRKEAMAHGSAAPIDYRIIRPDGEERVLHSEHGVDFDEKGKPARLYGIIQDITERKKIELELRHSRETLVRAQRIARVGSFERDFATGNVEWSDEMYHILGLEKASAPPGPETLLKLVHPEDRDAFMAYRDGEISGQPLTSIEYRILRPDGEERVVQRESDMLFDEQGRPVRRSGTLQDITERRVAERRERELERKLLHSQKLEALGTLAGGIAHDLNNTLVPIMALSKVAARELEPGNSLRAKLDTIFAASEQARDLVKRVLAFSRRDQIEKRPANLQAIVNEALALMRATLPTSIVLDARIGAVPVIDADPSQIHQVVTNLVTNAAQAIGPGLGTITVTLALIPERAERGTIHLSVADTGAGMDETTRQRIFEPFFTTKHVGQGTGLGLSIVENIVTDHGGRIDLTSAPGKGACFDIYFRVPGVRASAA